MFTEIIQGSGGAVTEFLQRLTSAMNNAVPGPGARQMLVETLAYEILNTKYKNVIRLLKVRAVDKGRRVDKGYNWYWF